MDPGLQRLLAGAPTDEIPAMVRLASGAAPPVRMRLVARFGEIATCRLPRNRIGAAWADEAVVSLKAPRPFGIDPDPLPVTDDVEAVGLRGDDRRPAISETGKGVIVAVIDWGFDFAHPNFRNPDGTTRALAFWDQSAEGPGPQPYGYGRVFRRDEINEALAHDDPYSALGYHPASGDPNNRGAHGAHVLDIAAGNGRAPGSPCGIAPEADLLFVHLDVAGTDGRANLGHSVSLAEGLHWVAHEAGDRCVVVNLSVGRHGGPHHGLTLVEQAIDALLAERKGIAIVQSAGNYYDACTHAHGTLRPGQDTSLCWITDAADITPNELELWYAGGDVFGLEFESPAGAKVKVALGDDEVIAIDGQEVGHVYHRAKDPSAGDNHINIFLDAAAPAGRWSLRLTGEDVVDGRWHAWVERDAGCPSCQSRFAPEDASPVCTTGTIANGFRAIAVGAYDAHRDSRSVTPFSSGGPTRDGRAKPDLLAPGARVLAARSTPRNGHVGSGRLFRQSGTSMAAPHVTGTIALMFEAAERALSIQETRRLLLSTAERPRDDDHPERCGSGRLNIEAAVAAARAISERPSVVERIERMIASTPIGSAVDSDDSDVAVAVAVDQECHCRKQQAVSEPESAPIDALASAPVNGMSVLDTRIDVDAQFSLLRMARGDASAQTDAAQMLGAVKAGALRGIYGDNTMPVVKLAQRHGTARWQFVRTGEDAALVLEAGDAAGVQPPTIVFRGGDPPRQHGARKPASRLDAALRKAWESYRWLRSGTSAACRLPNAPAIETLVPACLPGTLIFPPLVPNVPQAATTPVLIDHQHVRRRCTDGKSWSADATVTKMAPDTMNPGFIKPDDLIEFDTKLDRALIDLIVDDKDFRKLLAAESIKKRWPSAGDRLRVALVDLSGSKLCKPGYAGWGSTTRMMGASSAKIAILYAAHQLIFDLNELARVQRLTTQAAFDTAAAAHFSQFTCAPSLKWLVELDTSSSPLKVKMSTELDDKLTIMVDASRQGGTAAASELILRIGFEFIASALWQSGLRHPTRGGLWFPNSYEPTPVAIPRNSKCHRGSGSRPVHWIGNPVREPTITITALSAATFMTLLAQQRLINATHSAQIESLMSRACIWAGDKTGARVRATKCGVAAGFKHEVVLLEANKVRYALAYLTKDATQWPPATHERFAKAIHQLIVANNP